MTKLRCGYAKERKKVVFGVKKLVFSVNKVVFGVKKLFL